MLYYNIDKRFKTVDARTFNQKETKNNQEKHHSIDAMLAAKVTS